MSLIDAIISHDESLLRNNVLKEYNKMKEKIKNLKTYLHKSLSKVFVYL